MAQKKIIIGRPINGISLNGNEWLMDGLGVSLMTFDSKEEAKQFLKDNATAELSEEDLEDSFVYEELDENESYEDD